MVQNTQENKIAFDTGPNQGNIALPLKGSLGVIFAYSGNVFFTNIRYGDAGFFGLSGKPNFSSRFARFCVVVA